MKIISEIRGMKLTYIAYFVFIVAVIVVLRSEILRDRMNDRIKKLEEKLKK